MAPDAEKTAVTAVPAWGDIPALLEFCDAVLPTLRLANGLYCFDREFGSPEVRGTSPRYTLMVALGAERGARAGLDLAVDATELADVVMADQAALTLGDRGLLLWLLARLGDDRADRVLAGLSSVRADDLVELEGMEIGWLVTGAAVAVGAGRSAEQLLAVVLDALWSRRATSSPLFHHKGAGRRAVLPNFATQIYSVLALAEVARATDDQKAIAAAVELSDLLIDSRDDDFGWPWLFHSERGTVVERYQVYSVHQDAMAPMALFAVSEVTGDDRYATAGAEGLEWCYGRNELSFHFYDPANRFAHRAIRRKGAADRAELWANTAFGLAGAPQRLDVGPRTINATCRPYHLGWVIEAWAGREDRIELVTGSR